MFPVASLFARRAWLTSMLCALLGLAADLHHACAQAVNYDIVYVRAPRYGDTTYARMPEVVNPLSLEPGSDLMLLHPNGSEEVLFAAGNGAVLDPVVSFDAQWVFFSYVPDMRAAALNSQRNNMPTGGADIYKIHLATRQLVRLTTQTWTPPKGAANWSSNHLTQSSADAFTLGYGIFNLAPCPLPNGKLMFVSSRDGYLPTKELTFPNLRLYLMDQDGRNVEPIGHLNIGSAMHPTVLKDGRVMFSSYETQGVRDSRVWSLWAIWPDGRKWEPLMSAMAPGQAFHFQTQLGDGRIGVIHYYNLNNNGFGTLLAFNSQKTPGAPPFGSADPNHPSNPDVQQGIWYFQPGHPSHLQPRYLKFRFSPPGLTNLSAFTHGEDNASSRLPDGSYAGKVTQPSAAPGNDVLLAWTPGPANNLNRPEATPRYDAGIYLLKGGAAITDPKAMVLIKNDLRYNEQQPKAVVPYSAIHGVAQPAALPHLPNDGSVHAALPSGTPFGLVGTASFYNRNTTPGDRTTRFGNLDAFNSSENDANYNWQNQGADAGKYANSDIHAVRIVAMEATAHRSYGPRAGEAAFRNHANERLRILGEIPLRKFNGAQPVLDADGNPDTSFLARIPADTPFTFQTLDKDGLVLNMAQTWHMVRPGEQRSDCGGCHAHANAPSDFSKTAAARPDYVITDLTKRTTLLAKDASGNTIVKEAPKRIADVEYYRDIKPILQRSCVQCHTKNGASPPAGLVLDDDSLVQGFDNTWHRLANDQSATYGIKPVISNGAWRQTNTSRYIRAFQSRRSLLMWKVMGRRLDGWLNSDHPTEATPGNPATLPAGANPNDADIDFTGTQMPPPGSGVQALSEDEKMTLARWIDLGAPVSSQDAALKNYGWFSDELKPTLTVASPRAEHATNALSLLRFGAFDNTSGLDRASLSVTANFDVNGQPPGAQLASLFSEVDHVWTLALSSPITSLAGGLLTVKVKDMQGNESVIERAFSIGSGAVEIVGETKVRYRLYSPVTLEHLFTTDFNEYAVLGTRGWIQEGAAHRVFASALGRVGSAQAVPYFRLYHPGILQHLWTVDANEYSVLGTRGWIQEGIDGYVLPREAPGAVPLYRMYHAGARIHHWTSDANEYVVLTTQRGWIDEGIAAFVLPP